MKEFGQEFFDFAGVTLAAAIAAALGGLGGLAFADKPSTRQAIWIVLAGVGTGAFGSRILEWQPGLPPLAASAAAFFLAICGMPILGLIFGVINRLRRRADSIADRGLDKVLPGSPAEKPPEVKP